MATGNPYMRGLIEKCMYRYPLDRIDSHSLVEAIQEHDGTTPVYMTAEEYHVNQNHFSDTSDRDFVEWSQPNIGASTTSEIS
jgi:hypothetical protein